MQDSEIMLRIYKAFNSRGISADGMYDFDAEVASRLFDQHNRLATYKPHPMEQGYSILKARIDSLLEVHKIIKSKLTLCLISNNVFLRKYAELIGKNNAD